MKLLVASIEEDRTTARYFEKAASAAGHAVTVTNRVAGRSLSEFDALLAFDPWMADLEALKNAPCPTLCLLIDVHRELCWRSLFARYLDHVFIAQKDYVPGFAALPHPNATWLPLAGDENIHFVAGLPRQTDVAFVGKFGAAGSERHNTLSDVLGAFSTNDTARTYTPAEMGRVYSGAKIVFNKSIGGDVNMRVFEAIAAGALLVTDRIDNGLTDLFVEDTHYVAYGSVEEAKTKIAHYLAYDGERAAIAAEGQAHLLAHHTYRHRLETMLAAVAGNGATGHAPARTAAVSEERRWRAAFYRTVGLPPWDALRFAGTARDPRVCLDVAVGAARHTRRTLRAKRVARRTS